MSGPHVESTQVQVLPLLLVPASHLHTWEAAGDGSVSESVSAWVPAGTPGACLWPGSLVGIYMESEAVDGRPACLPAFQNNYIKKKFLEV